MGVRTLWAYINNTRRGYYMRSLAPYGIPIPLIGVPVGWLKGEPYGQTDQLSCKLTFILQLKRRYFRSVGGFGILFAIRAGRFVATAAASVVSNGELRESAIKGSARAVYVRKAIGAPSQLMRWEASNL